jgi:hypothetical protein
MVENILFSGINTMWLLLMWLGVALRSRNAGLDYATQKVVRRLPNGRLSIIRIPVPNRANELSPNSPRR